MDHQTKVVHTLGFPLDYNGNVSRVLGEAIQVHKLGCEVHVIVSEQVPLRYLRKALDNGIIIHPIRTLIPYKEIGWRINNVLPLFVETFRCLMNNSINILHVSAPTPVSKPLIASGTGKMLKRPIVLDLHDPWSSDPFSHNPILMLQTSIMRHVIKEADFIIVAHTALTELVRKIERRTPVEVIPFGVDIELFQPKPQNPSISKRLNIDKDDIVIAFSGHITESKGLDVLIRSAELIRKNHRNVKFLIIGDGPERKKAEDLVRKQQLNDVFRFVGYLPQEDVVEHLSLADICVAPYRPMDFFKLSLPETPLKVVEYLAMGKPVVMSRISDENVVSWSGGGSLVRPGNVSELASTITDLINDEKTRKNQGRRGREYIEKNLSWSKIAQRLLKIYEEVLPA